MSMAEEDFLPMKNFTAGDKTNTSVASGSFVILSGFDETKEYFVSVHDGIIDIRHSRMRGRGKG